MYTPSVFADFEGHVLAQFMVDNPFATLICGDATGEVHITHIPIMVTTGPAGIRLAGHLARQNPQWRSFDGIQKAVVVFHGAHAYISPRWYETASVPTWNYAAVHAHGTPLVTTAPADLERDVLSLVSRYERGPDALDPNQLVAQFRSQLSAVVGFTMQVSRLEGKFKLNQNRSTADQTHVTSALLGSDSAGDRACGALMQERLNRPFTISRAEMADADGVLNCLQTAFEPFRDQYTPGGYEDTVMTSASILDRMAAMTVLVARDRAGAIIGTVGGNVTGDDGHIRGMAVMPEWQGRGTADALLHAIELELAGRCARITLDSTAPLTRAMRFYERHGYSRSGVVSDFYGMPLYEFVKL